MDPLHARYPFFEAAREAVATADVALADLVAAGAPAVDRGRERVERALLEGTVESETPEEYDVRDELLSYPIARILVSLLDSSAAVEKYAASEARTAAERFAADFERGDDGLTYAEPGVDLEDVLREFDLADDVRPESTPSSRPAERYRLRVGRYLELSSSSWGDEWRLVNRELAAGWVRVDRDELLRCLRAAVRSRVRDGLPFELESDDALAAALETQVADLERLLSERTHVGEIDAVVPELFPPCMVNLIEKAERDVELSAPESFALMAFLTGIGMDPDEIVVFCRDTSLDAEGIRYQTEYLRDDTGTQYPPPTCETLSTYGICHNEDDHWRVAAGPLSYYESRLADADDGELVDWRERANG